MLFRKVFKISKYFSSGQYVDWSSASKLCKTGEMLQSVAKLRIICFLRSECYNKVKYGREGQPLFRQNKRFFSFSSDQKVLKNYYLYVYLSIHLSIYLSIYQPIYLHIYLSIYLAIYLPRLTGLRTSWWESRRSSRPSPRSLTRPSPRCPDTREICSPNLKLDNIVLACNLTTQSKLEA